MIPVCPRLLNMITGFVALLSSGLRGFKRHRSYIIIIFIIIIVIAIICSNLRSVYTSINQFDASMSALIGMISCKFVHILFVLYGTLHVTSKAWYDITLSFVMHRETIQSIAV